MCRAAKDFLSVQTPTKSECFVKAEEHTGLSRHSEHESSAAGLLRYGQDCLQMEAEVSRALKHEKPEVQQKS